MYLQKDLEESFGKSWCVLRGMQGPKVPRIEQLEWKGSRVGERGDRVTRREKHEA